MNTRTIQLCAGLAALSFSLAAAAGDELVIAQIASVTNIASASAAKANNAGLQAYIDSVNARGGVGGRNIKIVLRDDDVNAATMVRMTKELVADKEVLALVNFLNTAGLSELSKQNLPEQAGIAMIAPVQGSKQIVGANNFFPFRSGYDDEVVALVKEARDTQKKSLAIFYFRSAFGPSMSQLAQNEAKNQGLNVVANVGIDSTPANFDANMKNAVAEIAKANPDAIFLICAGRYGTEFVKLIRDTPAAAAQLYSISVLYADDVVKAAGVKKAHGLVIAQATPFPFALTSPLVYEYQRVMKQYAPNTPLSFSSLEGYIGGKITVEALKRAGSNPTRQKVLAALNNFGEWDLGGVYVNYGGKGRFGWRGVDLTIVASSGKLVH